MPLELVHDPFQHLMSSQILKMPINATINTTSGSSYVLHAHKENSVMEPAQFVSYLAS